MSGETVEATVVEKLDALIVFPTGEAMLKQQAQAYSALPPIQGPDDVMGLKVTREAWLTLRGYRTKIESDRKTIKAPFMDACKKIDEEAKRLTAICQATETALHERVQTVEAQIEERNRRVVTERQDQFRAVEMILPDEVVAGMDDETFKTQLEGARLRYEAVARQRADEAAAAERKRLEDAAAAQKLADDRKKLDDEMAEFRRQKAEFEASKPKPPEPAADPVKNLVTEAPRSIPSGGVARPRKWMHDCPFCKCPAVGS